MLLKNKSASFNGKNSFKIFALQNVNQGRNSKTNFKKI